MDTAKLKYTAYFAHFCGFLAVLLGFLTLNGFISYEVISRTEAVLGLAVGCGTIYLGRSTLKMIDRMEGR
ncbi:hypothetical protein [Diaphorobacter sp. J5-51]|uniref:hypothetical protein n=1 Tax=Diaphorobacter sp. J5-51 TaxID=680496 RepID=UPI000643BE33|nr:hypothetical protein [Diaphorobacter sp. J5-51]KLR58079.1 hypothetical protein OX89_08965 [Diaphorobacter sp. J5-51]